MARKIDDELREMLKEEHSTVVKEADEPSTLMGRWFQEADDDDAEDEGESLEDIEKDMDNIDDDDDSDDDDEKDDDEDDDIGKDDSDVQNEYDDNDLNALNELIADEQHAMQAYFKAGKETKNVLLSRLYNDIGAEEAFHSEQLLYAKAELTGEKYEPSDPEVKKEYEELLENGMDEETAMYTIADKHKLDGGKDDEDAEELEEIEKDMESLGESFTQTIANIELLMAIQESGAYKNHADLRKAYCEFAENVFFQEAVDNVATKQGSEILGTSNPFLIIGRAIKSVYMMIIDMVKKVKNWINKRRIKSKRVMQWLKKNGIKGLFAHGVKLYFWDPQSGSVDVSDAVAFMNLCMTLTQWVAKAVGVGEPRVNNGKASGTAFINNAKSKGLSFTSIQDGKHVVDGVVFSKSKVVVNDNNAGELEQIFFGVSGNTFVTSQDEGSTYDVKSRNIYNSLQYILEWASEQLRATQEWIEKSMMPAAGRQRGIAYTKPEIFKQCTDAMKSVSKGYARITKCLQHDITACMKLDQGLLNAVNGIDEARDSHDPLSEKKLDKTIPMDSGARDSVGNLRTSGM